MSNTKFVSLLVAAALSCLSAACGEDYSTETPPAATTSSSSASSSSGATSTTSTQDITKCQDRCNAQQAQGCIDAATLSKCRATCSTAAADSRESFVACAGGTGGLCSKGAACVAQLIKQGATPISTPSPDTTNAADCQGHCDTIHAQGCIDAAALWSCRGTCASTTLTKRDDFNACIQGTGNLCSKSADCAAELLR